MTQHMTPHKEWLNSYKLLDKPLTIYMGDDQQHQVVSIKEIIIHLHFNHITIVNDVMYILALAKNLISICNAAKQGQNNISFFHDHCKFFDLFTKMGEITITCHQKTHYI
jgi:hypothetical protein